MASKTITIPKFRSEQEEAEWWDSHPKLATRLLKAAMDRGAVIGIPPETRTEQS